jgi:oxalate decarboxylase
MRSSEPLSDVQFIPGAFREPHWHPNAHELTYCAKGSSLVTVFSNGNLHDTFTIAQGEMFFVPSGYLHAIANTGGENAEFLIAFSHHEPEDFGISGAVGCMNANVMGNTWGIPETAAKGVRYSPEDIVIGKFQGVLDIPWAAGFSNHYKLPVESLAPMLATEFGSARTARKQFWPVLEGLSMYSLRLLGWHLDLKASCAHFPEARNPSQRFADANEVPAWLAQELAVGDSQRPDRTPIYHLDDGPS